MKVSLFGFEGCADVMDPSVQEFHICTCYSWLSRDGLAALSVEVFYDKVSWCFTRHDPSMGKLIEMNVTERGISSQLVDLLRKNFPVS